MANWLDKYNTDSNVAKTDATRVAAPNLKLTKAQLEKNKAINKQVMAKTNKAKAEEVAKRTAARNKPGKTVSEVFTSKEPYNIQERFRLFPGDTEYGQVFDEFVNPAYFTAQVASNLGNALQSGDYKGAATEAAMAAGAGALGFDPLGSAIKVPGKVAQSMESGLISNAHKLNVIKVPDLPFVKNLKDLEYAKQFAEQYGYKLPENLQRIAQSDELTNRTIRGMMDRHNTFVRGVSTNWDVIGKKNPEILKHLEQQGIDWKNNPKAAAEYMSTHVPIQTGYGRASLDKNVFDQGLDAIYTSNSIPTAEGYTYGQGFITKVKKPTDFSSANRQDWINQNNLKYYKDDLPWDNFDKNLLKTETVTNNDIMRHLANDIVYSQEKFPGLLDDVATSKNITRKYKELNEEYPTWHYGEEAKLNKEKFNTKFYEFLKTIDNPTVQDLVNFHKNRENYAHYIHLGKPGEQVLQPVKSWEITPDIWKNKDRSHINIPTDKLSRAAVAPLGLAAGESLIEPEQKKNGGWLDKYDDGGEVEGTERTPIFNSDTLTFPTHSYARFVSDDKKSRLKGTSDNGEINKAADWLTTWFSSPGAKRRFSEGLAVKSDNFTKQALQDAKDNINNVYVLNNYSDLIDKDILDAGNLGKQKDANIESILSRINLLRAKRSALENAEEYRDTRNLGAGSYTAGFYKPSGHILNITKGITPDIERETAVHELTHASNLDDYYISFGNQILNKYPIGKSNGMSLFPLNTKSKKDQKDAEYIKHDGAYPRLMEIRYNSKINPNQVITPKQFEKIKTQNKGNDLFRYYTDHDIINMLNHFAANDNAVQSDVMQAEYGTELNANNASTSFPPNFVGQGYDITGRDYSPAWGGQFDNGGELPNVTVKGKKQPIIVTNPNDPRLKAYKDSLSLYNEGEKNYKKRLEFNKKNNIPKSSTRKWNDPVEYHVVNKKGDIQLNKIQPIEGNGYWYNFDPDNVAGTNVPSSLTDNYGFRYKKPTQPVEYINRVKQTETPELQDLAMGIPVNISLPELQRLKGPNRITMGRPLFKGGPQTDYYTPIDEAGNVVQSADFKTSQFAMGGSMPGAVGFMYAREGAPSKGPRRNQTTVTDASADNGGNFPGKWTGDLRTIWNANKSARDYNLQYTQSPNFKNLLKKQGYTPAEIKQRHQAIVDLDSSRTSYNSPDFNHVNPDIFGVERLHYNPKALGDWDNWGDIAAHEWGHSGVTGGVGSLALKPAEQKLLTNSLNWANVSTDPDARAHDIAPQENRADLVELRKALQDRKIYDSFKGGEFKQEHLDKLRQHDKIHHQDPEYWNRSMRLYKDKDIIKLMNTIASNDPQQGMPVAQNGMEMKYYQDGLDFRPKSMKQGGQLTKLDQLTNFTNYNTKQSGGWLDKYND